MGAQRLTTRDSLAQELLGTGHDTTYLEIGVQNGVTFRGIRSATKIGVDPVLRIKPTRKPLRKAWQIEGHANRLLRRHEGELLYPLTSDEFFRRNPWLRNVDVALVDGLHTFDQSYRDVINCLKIMSHNGVIIMHDCNPQSAVAAMNSLDEARVTPGYTGLWNGDVFKAVVKLRLELSDHRVAVVDSDQGLGVIFKGKSTNLPSISEAEIASLTYADLEQDRASLLGLVDPDELWTELVPAMSQAGSG